MVINFHHAMTSTWNVDMTSLTVKESSGSMGLPGSKQPAPPSPPSPSSPSSSSAAAQEGFLGEEEHSKWSLLPPEMMLQIFRHLPDRDRCSAGQVCWSWNRAYHIPQLWRTRFFHFRGVDDFQEAAFASLYMQTLGSHLRNLKVEVDLWEIVSPEAVIKVLNASPHDMRLRSFSFDVDLFYFRERAWPRLVRALCDFLGHQLWLQEVRLGSCWMSRPHGLQVLRALAQRYLPSRNTGTPGTQPGGKISRLALCEFFNKVEADVLGCPAFLEIMGRFRALREVELSFIYLSDNLLDVLTRTNAKTLKLVSLEVDDDEMNEEHPAQVGLMRRMATAAGWRAARTFCPALRVHVRMTRVSVGRIPRLLPTDMPLDKLKYTQGGERLGLAEATGVVDYLARNFARALRHFDLDFYHPPSGPWRDGAAVVGLVRACSSLRKLSLNLTVPIHTVLQAVAASKPSSLERPPLCIHVRRFERSVSSEELKAQLARLGAERSSVRTGA